MVVVPLLNYIVYITPLHLYKTTTATARSGARTLQQGAATGGVVAEPPGLENFVFFEK